MRKKVTTGDSKGNILPEIFFGFYTTSGHGLDIGVVLKLGGKWNVGTNRALSLVNYDEKIQWQDSKHPDFTLNPGEDL